MEIPDELIADMIPAVREQMTMPDMAYVADCLQRLMEKEGLEEAEAMELMAQALAITVNDMMLTGKAFDAAKYKSLLKSLPMLPDEQES